MELGGTAEKPADVATVASRQRLLTSKREDLATVIDSHDTFVRELFHLTKFTTLIGFDPIEAKEDRSTVFENFRSPYDLVAKLNAAAEASSSRSPARKTRRALTGRLESLIAVPVIPTKSQALPSTLSLSKGKGKAIVSNGGVAEAGNSAGRRASTGSTLHSGRGRGRGGRRLSLAHTNGHAILDDDSPEPEDVSVAPTSPKHRKYGHKRSKLKLAPEGSSLSSSSFPIQPPHSPSRKKHKASSPPQLTSRPFKRVKLIVKPPLPPYLRPIDYTHPSQIPQPSAFGNSLTKLLDSYTHLEEDETGSLTIEELEERAKEDARLLRQIEIFKSQGRLNQPAPEEGEQRVVRRRPQPEPARSKDHQDHLVAHIIHAGKAIRDEGKARVGIARKVSKLISAYWEKAAGAQDREKKAEEKRIRTLAKTVVRAVQDAWKVIVKDVRDVKLQLEKEEQVRLGRHHLNRILQQSSQVLEAQHMDLRGESRSSTSVSVSRDGSVSRWVKEGSIMTDMEEDVLEEEDEEEEEGSDGADREGSVDVDGASLLDDTEDRDGQNDTEELDEEESRDGGDEEESEESSEEDEGDPVETPIDVEQGVPADGDDLSMDVREPIDEPGEMNWTPDAPEDKEFDEQSPTQEYIGATPAVNEPTKDSVIPAIFLESTQRGAPPLEDTQLLASASAPPLNGHASPRELLNTPAETFSAAQVESQSTSAAHTPNHRDDSQTDHVPRERSRRPVSIRTPPPQSKLLREEGESVDDEFKDPTDPDQEGLDMKMDLDMEAEEEQQGEYEDSELEGLEGDADLPLEELMRRYGYAPVEGVAGEEQEEEDEEQEEGAVEDQPEEEVDHAMALPEPTVSPRELSVDDSEHTIPRSDKQSPEQHVNGLTSEEGVRHQPVSAQELEDSALSSFQPDVIASPSTEIVQSALDLAEPNAASLSESESRASSPTQEESDHSGSRSEVDDDDDSQNGIIPVTKFSSDSGTKIRAPFLLRGTLRPYQHAGLEWLASLYANGLNGILADEMGLGKTIQTIALLAYLACEKGIWGPHLVIVPTSVLVNWQMEFKKFFPGFKTIAYYGPPKQREKLRVGWNTEHTFNVCITSYQLVVADEKIFRRKAWHYMILDEAHNIKNFQSKRWKILLGFNSVRRLLLTGTPLQNNLTELWSLLGFLMPSGVSQGFGEGTFANHKEFAEWFSNPLIQAIESGKNMDDAETRATVTKLHTLLRPYILRRLKADVEKQLPGKFEHIVYCRLAKRQRLLYDEFMSRASTKETLASNNVLSIVACLMQLRKVCNHPDLFESRPIVTSFAMTRSAVAEYEIKELLVRRKLLHSDPLDNIDLDACGLHFILHEGVSSIAARERRFLDASSRFPLITELPNERPPTDTHTMEGYRRHWEYQQQAATVARWRLISVVNRPRCSYLPVYSRGKLTAAQQLYRPLAPLPIVETDRKHHFDQSTIVPTMVSSYAQRAEAIESTISRFAFATPTVVALDLPARAIPEADPVLHSGIQWDTDFDILHKSSIKLQIQFPDAALLQYDCGKLQELARLLQERKAGGHKVLIFTQMTKVLDVLEMFLSFNGFRYLRLDGSTKTEERPRLTERFNVDPRIFAFISSSRAGGIGINLTGADTVIFYDSDYNPSMDKQCEDRAHRIGQVRDVHIYRFISRHTVEESMLKKANQKRSLDDLVIQKGEFDWRRILDDDVQMTKAFEQVEDKEDVEAAHNAANEISKDEMLNQREFDEAVGPDVENGGTGGKDVDGEDDDDVPPLARYMMSIVKRDWEYFSEWRIK